MELYALVAGQMDSMNRWQQDLNAQWLPVYKNGKKIPMKHSKTGKVLKDSNGNVMYAQRRLLVAPVQLFKIAFAKEELNNVLAMVCPQDYMTKRYKGLGWGTKLIRSKLGLKECPIPKLVNPFLQPNQMDKAVGIMPIGIKEDMINEHGEEMI